MWLPRGEKEGLLGLLWKVPSSLGVNTGEGIPAWSTSEIETNKNKRTHQGSIVCAHKIPDVEMGCLFLNHWRQTVAKVTSHDRQRGVKGVELGPGGLELR